MNKLIVMAVSPAVTVVLIVLGSILLLAGGFALGFFIVRSKLKKAGQSAKAFLEVAQKEADEYKKELILGAKQEVHLLKQEFEKENRERTNYLNSLENKVNQREERLDNRSINLDKRESTISRKEEALEKQKVELEEKTSKVETLVQEQTEKLLEISKLDKEEAKKIVLKQVEEEMDLEISQIVKEGVDKANAEVHKKTKELLTQVIQTYAGEIVAEQTVSVVNLPNDEMKGRIIGREGRNIRALEAATGVDLIIDDTPEAVVVSCFDPVRREVARRTLEALISDGRIQPTRIEEIVQKFEKEMDLEIKEAGDKAVYDTGIGRVHPELVKLLGRLKFRTSYGQNALAHSIEVAMIAGNLAVEIGENEIIARRAGLFHDIGKAVDTTMEGSHVELGADIVRRYRERPEVIDAVLSHHGDETANSIIAVLVATADTISAARPGARNESIEAYIKRLETLEALVSKHKGVERSYALQAGREIRVMVKPAEINDAQAEKLALELKKEIEKELTYPGTIKITVIRETRVNQVAK